MKLTDAINPGKIIFRGRTYSPNEVRLNIDDVAKHLEKTLPADKPFVYLFGVNHVKFIFAYFAIIKSGHIAVIIEPKIGPIEYAEQLAKVPPTAVININTETMEWELENEIEVKENGEMYTDELDDVCTMIFHAADDGHAKALMLTNKSLWADANAHATTNVSSISSLICAIAPYCHVYSLTTGVISPFLGGAAILVIGQSESKRFSTVFEQRPSHIYAVPATFHFMQKEGRLAFPGAQECTFTSGGYKLPLRVFEDFRACFGTEIREGYGLSEASPVCTWHHPSDNVNIESVGTAFSCCSLRIASEQGDPLPTGTRGEVLVAGENVFKGYYRDAKATRKVLHNGWLKTHDLGWLDEKGHLFLDGNRRRMLNVMGKKVFPAEVERLVLMNENVEAVSVFGTWKELSGHSIHAKVSLKRPGTDEVEKLRAWCKYSITPYKVPKFSEEGRSNEQF